MTELAPVENALVLYKGRPARIVRITDKLELELEEGKTQRVRAKDVALLHPGPVRSLGELVPLPGEPEAAWELLAGESTTLPELAELAFGEHTPASAWSAWQLVADGLYFQGTPESVSARDPAAVRTEREARAQREVELRAWERFVDRVEARQVAAEDERYLGEVEAVAYGRRAYSRVLRHFGQAETPEAAHAFLLKVGYWNETVNPYPQRFEAHREAPALLPPPLPEEDRVDLTHLPAYAIDDEGNEDPDDALSLDGDRLWVHVADVAALVPPDTPLDREARARAASLYLPERTLSMLPDGVTQALGLGLQPISPALSFGLRLDASDRIVDLELARTWIRAERLSYGTVEQRLHEEPFRSLHALAQRYQARRLRDGAALIRLPEARVKVRAGQVSVDSLPRLRSRDLVTEAMLMVGEATAAFALEQGIPMPFSTQQAPDSRDFSLSVSGMFALRRQMRRSQMKTVAEPHAGLGLGAYTQATSPLRRYLDLVAHQQLRAFLAGRPTLTQEEVLLRVGATDALTPVLRRTERHSNRHWTLVYLRQNPDWQGQGILVECKARRGAILIPELALEASIAIKGTPALDTVYALSPTGIDLPLLEAYFSAAPVGS